MFVWHKMMNRELYNELPKVYTKDALASMITADIRNRFPDPYANIYCHQFDNFKDAADFFEYADRIMRR